MGLSAAWPPGLIRSDAAGSQNLDAACRRFSSVQLRPSRSGVSGPIQAELLIGRVTAAIEAAVPSYLGLQVTIRQSGHPVTLTRITPHRTATTSLRIPLTVLGPRFDPDSRVTFYAAAAARSSTSPPTSATPSTYPPRVIDPPTQAVQTAMTGGTVRSTTIGESPLMPMCREALWFRGCPGCPSCPPSTGPSVF
jgi:hypothetical protein